MNKLKINSYGTGFLTVTISFTDKTSEILNPINVVHYTVGDETSIHYARALEISQVGTGRNFNEAVKDLSDNVNKFIKDVLIKGENLAVYNSPDLYWKAWEKESETAKIDNFFVIKSSLKSLLRKRETHWHKSILKNKGKKIKGYKPGYQISVA